MKRKKYILCFLIFVFSLTILVACYKKDKGDRNEEHGVKSRTELLTLRPWKLIKIEHRYNEKDEWQPSALIPECQKDDTRLFKIDGTMEFNRGSVKCEPNEKQVFTISNWKWNDDKTELTIVDIDTKIASINKMIKLTETEQVATSNTFLNGKKIYYRSTLVH